jgi:hypothetical protein
MNKLAAAVAFVLCGFSSMMVIGCLMDSNPTGVHDTLTIIVTDTSGYTLTPTTTAGETITPSVPVTVSAGNMQIFIAKPDIFYILDSVTEGCRFRPARWVTWRMYSM